MTTAERLLRDAREYLGQPDAYYGEKQLCERIDAHLASIKAKESAAGDWDTSTSSRMAAEQAIVAAKNRERWRKV